MPIIGRRVEALPASVKRWPSGFSPRARRMARASSTSEAPPLKGSPQQLASNLSDFADAGADEAILVVNPISERSIRDLGAVLSLVRTA